MGRLKVLDNLVLGPRLVCLVWGPSSLPNTRLCPILGSKNLDKMGLDKMRSDLSFSYEDILSYQVFSTPRLVLSWGARSQTGAQNPIVQGGLALGTSPFFFCCFFLRIFHFKNAHSTIQYKLAWHITMPPNFYRIQVRS